MSADTKSDLHDWLECQEGMWGIIEAKPGKGGQEMTPRVADRIKSKKAQSKHRGKDSRVSRAREARQILRSKLAQGRETTDVVLVRAPGGVSKPVQVPEPSVSSADKRKQPLVVDVTREFSHSGLEISGTMDGYW